MNLRKECCTTEVATAAMHRSTCLAQRFTDDHGGGDGDVKRAHAGPHLDDDMGIGPFVHLLGHTATLATKEENIVGSVGEAVIGAGGFRRREDQPAAGGAVKCLESVPVDMMGESCLFGIVETGALQCSIGKIEACRADNVDAETETGGHPQDGTCVSRDVGLVEGNAKLAHGRMPDASYLGEPCDTLPLSVRQQHAPWRSQPACWNIRNAASVSRAGS